MTATTTAVRTAGRTVGALALLSAALPANVALTAAASLTARRKPPAVTDRPRTVLISGGKMTKALHLARAFHRAGHRVVLTETAHYRLTGHRFSRAVDAFHVVPSPDDPAYADALLAIVRAEGVDVYVPVCSPLASRYDALAGELLAPYCEVLHGDAETVRRLDDKYQFSLLCDSLDLPVAESHLITDPQQVEDFDFAAHDHTYVLKSIAYDPVRRLDLTQLPCATPAETAAFARSLPISVDNPWVMQAFVPGTEYCTHSTVRAGEVTVYGCCESSAFQVNYEMVDRPEIAEWVTRFAKGLGLTGQVSFDFIETDGGRLFAIECNPRTHSAITMFHDHPGLAAAYLGGTGRTLTPLAGSRPTYWLYQELWRLLSAPLTLPRTVRTLRHGNDAIFDRADPLPFLLVHHLQIPSLLLGSLVRGRPWNRVDFNIGKLVEPAGD